MQREVDRGVADVVKLCLSGGRGCECASMFDFRLYKNTKRHLERRNHYRHGGNGRDRCGRVVLRMLSLAHR